MTRYVPIVLCALTMQIAGYAHADGGLLAHWNFDDGKGDVAVDATGNGHDARLHGATFVKQGKGFAVSLDGVDDYVDCTPEKKLDITKSVAMSAWIKPTRKAKGEASLIGEGMGSFTLTYYNTELCFFYIGEGGNNLKEHLVLNQWQHVAASFDGTHMKLWINGQLVGNRESTKKQFSTNGNVMIGTKGRPDLPRFKGLVDDVRIYNRALSDDELVAQVKDGAIDHGIAMAGGGAGAAAGATAFFKSHPNVIDVKEQGSSILFANKQIGLEFGKGKKGFQINRLFGIEQDQEYLAKENVIGFRELFDIRMTPDLRGSARDHRNDSNKSSLMGIMDEMAADAFSVTTHSAQSVSWKTSQSDGNTTLHLNWNKIFVRGESHVMDVEVTVTLKPGDPLSYWRINVINPGVRFGIERVRFPLIPLAPIENTKDNVYIYPREHGGYVEDPFNAPTGFGVGLNSKGAHYPVDFNMQFQALYNKKALKGIYLATQDSTPNLMHMRIANTPQQIVWKPAHFPPNITFAEESYYQPYDCVVGPFDGDWYDAAQIYRSWAVKQRWCSKGPRLTRKDTPRWYSETPFMFYTVVGDSAEGTHSMSKNAVIAADHFREWIKWAGFPLPCNWYSWKQYVPGQTSYNVPFGSHRMYHQGRWKGMWPMNIHDGNYPAIGAIKEYTEQTHKLRKEGGMVSPYVALEIFDQGPDENSPYAREARPHMVRDLFGVKRSWSNETAWQACVGTKWWQNRMRETCGEMVKREHIGGLYLDVMQGSGLPCYWTPHGHSACGGDAITTGMWETVKACREAAHAVDPEVMITGENICENVIDVVDGTLQVTLWPENRAHVFAAVYQDYTKRYGTEMSTGIGARGQFKENFADDSFFLEAASLFAQGAQIGRMRLRPRNAALSVSEPKQSHIIAFLEQVRDYYRNKQTMMFHAYGQFMRPLVFSSPSPMPTIRYGKNDFRALWNGVFRNADGELGVFIINAGRPEIAYESAMPLARHGMSADAVVDVDSITPAGKVTTVHRGAKGTVKLKATIPGRTIHMYRIKPAGQ